MSEKIIQLSEDLIKHNLKELVLSSVEETLNDLLDKEADELINADKYERSANRQGYRSGYYYRNIFSVTPRNKKKAVALMLKAIHFQESKEAASEKAIQVVEKLKALKLAKVAKKVEVLWSSIFVTLAPNNFVFRTGLRTVSGNRYKNGALHGCTKYMRNPILLDSVHHHYGSNVNLLVRFSEYCNISP